MGQDLKLCSYGPEVYKLIITLREVNKIAIQPVIRNINK